MQRGIGGGGDFWHKPFHYDTDGLQGGTGKLSGS